MIVNCIDFVFIDKLRDRHIELREPFSPGRAPGPGERR
jgi:hypothetical protein